MRYFNAAILLIALQCCLVSCHSDTATRHPEPPDTIRWATFSRQPFAERQAGVQRMLADDPKTFWDRAAKRTLQIDDWPMIRLLCDEAQASRDVRALPWLVRSWAMPSVTVSDAERPERDAIEAITGERGIDRLRSIVFDHATEHEPATQVAAWTVLVRIDSHDALRGRVSAAPDDEISELVGALKRVVPAVDVLPQDRLAVVQMLRLLTTYDEVHWQAWADWRASNQGDGLATLSLRHLPTLLHRDQARDAWHRKDWLNHIEKHLAGRRHATRGDRADEDIVVSRRPERFADHADQLGVADLILLDHLLMAMDDPRVRDAAFEQAEADRLDTTTEYGGVLIWNEDARLVLQPFAPWIQQHDQAYIASAHCLQAAHTGLAHFHFHTQKHRNAAWAGPSKGDLDFVDTHHINAVVMTYLDASTLNVDAYFPGGITIDLGCMTR